jgi:electron transfer flavoprotein alpha subunit
MGYLKIHQKRITKAAADALTALCPFGALEYDGRKLEVNAACRMCRICVRKGPAGCMEFVEEDAAVDKDRWRGIAVFAEVRQCGVHPVTLELLGKARELAQVTGHPVYAVLVGYQTDSAAKTLTAYGADAVYVYDTPEFEKICLDIYANAFSDFIERIRPSSVLVGATNLGRTLAPRVAARFHTGLTADCTALEMKENTDLVQIRPAFGGNIMARIVTPNHRPQFCTVRYKVFSMPAKKERRGTVYRLELPEEKRSSSFKVLSAVEKPKVMDISEADVIVACGRGIRSRDDLRLAEELAEALGAQVACTRPLVECGWFDPKKQIGLSGRTVKAKLIITVGVSGSVQFVAGMQGSEHIVAINTDPQASIFSIASLGLVGDLYRILPELTSQIKEMKNEPV